MPKMPRPDTFECGDSESKGTTFVCRIAQNLQNKEVPVSYSEIEDAILSISKLGNQIKNRDDLKAVLKAALAKSEQASLVFDEAFDMAAKETFKPTRKKSLEDVESKL